MRRAKAVDPGFSLTGENVADVAELCARLQGLPLAIELAARRIRMLSPKDILERTATVLPLLTGGPRDAPPRHPAVRNTIRWSEDLLDESVRGFFHCLSVFAGGFTLDDAASVAGSRSESAAVTIDMLEALIDASLIYRVRKESDSRFHMLRVIREYAAERLADAGESERVADRHAMSFLRLAESARGELTGRRQGQWLLRLDEEHDNVRAALRHSLETKRSQVGLRIASSMWRYWRIRGHLSEGRRWLDGFLAFPTDAEGVSARAAGLDAVAGLAYWQNDFAVAETRYNEALELYKKLGDDPGVAWATYSLGYMALIRRQADLAWSRYEQARDLWLAAGDERSRLRDDVARTVRASGGSPDHPVISASRVSACSDRPMRDSASKKPSARWDGSRSFSVTRKWDFVTSRNGPPS